jgi:hypothetical protein
MKPALTIPVAAVSMLTSVAAAEGLDENPSLDRAPSLETDKSTGVDPQDAAVKGSLRVQGSSFTAPSIDATSYREAANGALCDLGREIARLKNELPGTAAAAWRTRVVALEEQYEHSRSLLAHLTPDEVSTEVSPEREDFVDAMAQMERSLEEARSEMSNGSAVGNITLKR